MYALQGLPAVFFSALAFHVIAAALGLLSGLGVPAFPNKIPLVQIVRSVRGVYFALKRRGLDAQQALRKKLSLVFTQKGQNKGKQNNLW